MACFVPFELEIKVVVVVLVVLTKFYELKIWSVIINNCVGTLEISAGRGIRTLETFRSQAFLTIPGLRPTRLGDPGSKSF